MDMITVPGNCQGSCQVQWAVAHNLMSDSPFFVARKIKKEPASFNALLIINHDVFRTIFVP